MTFTAAVATGGAVDHLVRQLRRSPSTTAVVRHRHLAVAHAVGSPWVTTHDDGEVAVVLDGRLHDLPAGISDVARHLVQRYRTLGDRVAHGLLGDAVVIVVDRRSDTLLVARDPLGVRPWYQAASGNDAVGASELATLVDLPGVDTEVDEAAAIEYLAAVCQSRGPTLYRGITTLEPGRTWVWSDGRATTTTHHRWRLEPEPDLSFDDAAQRCRAVLAEAVRVRLDAGTSATAELSGGLDSSSVVGTMAGLGRHDLLAGRLVFEGPDADERVWSDAVRDHWGIPLVSAAPWVGSAERCTELTVELRRPLPDPHFTMFTSLHEALLAEGRIDGLTGLGGDDAFAITGIGGRVVSAVQLRRWSIVRQIATAGVRRPTAAWRELARPTLHHLAPWRGEPIPAWVRREPARRTGLVDLLRRPAPTVTGVDAIDERIANLTDGYTAAILELRAVVADGLGRRDSHPFLDPRFIEATYALDPWWPTRGGHTRALEVEAYRDRLPVVVADRRSKAGFAEVFWGDLLSPETIADIVNGPLVELGWLDAGGYARLVERGRSSINPAAIPLSRCASLDRWLRSR